jgi:hypothetical protein
LFRGQCSLHDCIYLIEVSDMINIQDYVSVPRTGKAGLRLASISSCTLSVRL